MSDKRDNVVFHHYSQFDFFNRSWNLKGALCLWSSVHQCLKGENTWKLKALWENPTGFRLLLPAQTYNISSNLPFSVYVPCFTLWELNVIERERREACLPLAVVLTSCYSFYRMLSWPFAAAAFPIFSFSVNIWFLELLCVTLRFPVSKQCLIHYLSFCICHAPSKVLEQPGPGFWWGK